MNPFVSCLGLVPRSVKPRQSGLTMVLDKFMGSNGTADLIETAAEYVDVVKLGWGSSVLYPEAALVKKLGMLRDAGVHVCPGGTFLETAFEHGKVEVILDLAKEIGFDAIEISNGIHPDMTRDDKLRMIRLATERGFHTMSEVGKKLPQEDGAMTYQQRIQEVREDLAAGARKVIMEARETGTVGIFKADGKINSELAYELFKHVDPDSILWEAPQKEQQVWLLRQLGPEVNIGNVPPSDVLSLESMRHGLRADTFRDHCKNSSCVFLELGVGGALRAQRRGDVVVVVDALRASATIVECLDKGARELIPVVSAQDLQGEVTIGERGGAKLPNADLGNSPREITREVVGGKSVVITSTNGTECIRTAKGPNSVVLIGTVTNCKAVAQAAVRIAKETGRNISLVAAGRNNLPAIEDRAGVTEIMKCIGNATPRGMLEPCFSDNLERDFLSSDSGVNLISLGYIDDVIYCSRLNISTSVPIFDGERIVAFN